MNTARVFRSSKRVEALRLSARDTHPVDWDTNDPRTQGDGGKLRLLKKRNFELGTQGVQAEAFGGDVLAFKNPAGGRFTRRAALF